MVKSKGAFWFFLVMGLVLLTAVAARVLPMGQGVRIALLAWQQFLFILGGFLGSRREIFKPLSGSILRQGFAAGLGLFLIQTVAGALTVWAAGRLVGAEAVQQLVFRDRAGVEMLVTSKEPLVVLATVLLLLVGAPVGEELFFRGLLVVLLRDRHGAYGAILLSTLLFTALHFYVLQFIPVFISGVLLGLLFIRSENIVLPILAHSTVNGLSLLILLSSL